MALGTEKLKRKETESEEIESIILAADISKLYVCVMVWSIHEIYMCLCKLQWENRSRGQIWPWNGEVHFLSCGQMMLMSLLSATLSANFLLGDLQTEKIGRYYSPSAPLKALFCSTIMHRGIQHQSRYHKPKHYSDISSTSTPKEDKIWHFKVTENHFVYADCAWQRLEIPRLC